MRNSWKAGLPALILILSLSCRFLTTEPSPTPGRVTQPPVETGTAVQTEPPVTAVPTSTDTPSAPTVTAAPTGLNPSGPYVIYGGTDGVWISNPDGSFLTQLTKLGINAGDLHQAISPGGDRMALVAANDQGLDLVEVRIPGGETRTIAHLLSVTPRELSDNPINAKAFATYAIRDYPSLAWQPGEGTLLAFMGASKGSTSDLYLYDTESGGITQLTDGPSQGVMPSWSPDGQYILHYGVSWRGPFGGAILGHDHLDGVWAVRVSDGEVLTMPTPKSIAVPFVGWQDETHYLTYDNGEDCAGNLHSVDVTDGKTSSITDLSFYFYIDLSPENGALLFSGSPQCANSPGEGAFLLLPGQTTPAKLTDKRAWSIRWLPESRVFLAYPEALFSADGQTRYDPPVYDKSFHPAVSRMGYQAWEVIENQQGRVVVKAPPEDWRTVLTGSVEQLTWDPVSGQTLLIVLRDGSLYAASYPDFTPRPLGAVKGVNQVIWLP